MMMMMMLIIIIMKSHVLCDKHMYQVWSSYDFWFKFKFCQHLFRSFEHFWVTTHPLPLVSILVYTIACTTVEAVVYATSQTLH